MKGRVGGSEKETQQSSLAHDSMIQPRITEDSFRGEKNGKALQRSANTKLNGFQNNWETSCNVDQFNENTVQKI